MSHLNVKLQTKGCSVTKEKILVSLIKGLIIETVTIEKEEVSKDLFQSASYIVSEIVKRKSLQPQSGGSIDITLRPLGEASGDFKKDFLSTIVRSYHLRFTEAGNVIIEEEVPSGFADGANFNGSKYSRKAQVIGTINN